LAEHDRTKARGKLPISRHPLFPATIALWFGALFGLGSLAIRPSALDSLAQKFHLGALGAIFEPPVDTAGRIAIVVAMAAIGAFIGLTMARRIVAPKGPSQAAAPQPVAQPELSDAESTLWSELKSRRREIEGDAEQPVGELPAEAPVLEREPQVLDVAAIEIEHFDGQPAEAEAWSQETAAEDEPFPPEAEDWLAPSEPIAETFAAEPAPADEEPAEPQETAAERIAGSDLADLSHVELLERLALSMQQRSERMAAAAQVASADDLTCEVLPDHEPVSETTQVHASWEPHVADVRADRHDAVTAVAAEPFAVTESSPTTAMIPAALLADNPSDESDEIEDEVLAEGYSSLLGLGRPTSPRPFVRVQQPAAVESEPAVVFPGHAERRSVPRPASEAAAPDHRPLAAPAVTEALPQDPADTEKALRDALAALQRMSGAA
jgi:hypothetical protein